jgi:hypothetical protein
MQTSIFRVETLTSPPVQIQDTQLRVRSQLVQVRLPMLNGGLIWNWPVSVAVQRADGQEQILAVPDVTRAAVWTLAGLSLAGMFLLRLSRRKNAES